MLLGILVFLCLLKAFGADGSSPSPATQSKVTQRPTENMASEWLIAPEPTWSSEDENEYQQYVQQYWEEAA